MNHDKTRMTVLVTGGAGYIGSVTTAALIKEGHIVIVLDNLSTGHREAVHPEAYFIKGDISDKKIIENICRQHIDVVVHFAACIEVQESVLNPSKYYGNNICKTICFLDNLRKCGVNKTVFSSTAAVYGNPVSIPLTESAPLNPVNPYGWTKLLIEQVLKDYDQAYNCKSVALRYFNAGGAYESFGEDHRPETHLIPRVLTAVLMNVPIEVYGDDYDTSDGSCIRDYIHVKDLADAHILAARYLCEGNQSDCFNLGTGKGISVLEVIRTVEKVIGRPVSYRITEKREGDSAVLVASSQKAQHVLGWKESQMTLEEIIESAWKWKQKFPEGYRE